MIVAKDASGNTTTQQYEFDLAGTTKSFTYDANGNLTTDATWTFEWDARNQLVTSAIGTTQWQFNYDGADRRVTTASYTSGSLSAQSQTIWSGLMRQEQRVLLGTNTKLFTEGQSQDGTVNFVTTDHLNSIRDIISNLGSRIAADAYDPLGNLTRDNTSAVTPRFAGMPSSEDGTFEAVYRIYQPGLGRWLTHDPSGFVDGPNLYAYVLNSPIAQSDQLGLQSFRKLLPACVDRILSDGNRLSQSGNPRRAHCVTTCRLTRECDSNPLAAVTLGFWKEVADTASCLASRNGRSCDTAFQPSDFKDNFKGAMCWLKPESCYSYCERTTPPGDGPAGPLSRLGKKR